MHRHRPTAQVIAHRGASAYAAEHSLAAYDLALTQGADALEIDVRATADGELVVAHDPTLLRTAVDPRRVDSLTRADLARLDPAVRPLRFEEVLARYGGVTGLLVDLKEPALAWENAVVAALTRHGLAGARVAAGPRVDLALGTPAAAVVQSFDHLALRRLRRRAPGLAVAPLLRRPPTARCVDAFEGWASGIGVRHDAVDAALVVRANATPLWAWTVNQAHAMERLLGLGVDGLITDRPDVARAAVNRAADAVRLAA